MNRQSKKFFGCHPKLYGIGGILLVVIVIGVVFFVSASGRKNPPREGTLTVNGVTYAESVKIYAGTKYSAPDAVVPLIAVLKNLGAEVVWRDGRTADITLEEKQYVFDLEAHSLIEGGGTFNLIATPPGGSNLYEEAEKELFLSAGTMDMAFYLMELPVVANVDYEAATVTIGCDAR